MSIFPRLNQRTKILLPIRTNLATYNEIPEHTVISSNTEIPSVQDGPTVVARYRNLTIHASYTLTTQYRCCGLILVVDGDLTINGTISMTARGANFQPLDDHRLTNELLPGKEVYYEIDIPATADEIADFLKKEKCRYRSFDELPAIYRPTFYARGPQGNVYAPADLGVVPAIGGAGGAKVSGAYDGNSGENGTNRQCGGGGGAAGSGRGSGGAGARGTCYSGGSGGGSGYDYSGQDAASYGGKGGDGVPSTDNRTASGAGNPAGADDNAKGVDGTGGLLVIACSGKIILNSTGVIISQGSRGGNLSTDNSYNAGGGGSGGGSINLFYGSIENNGGTILATGGAGGTGKYIGGAGGDGCVTLDQYNF